MLQINIFLKLILSLISMQIYKKNKQIIILLVLFMMKRPIYRLTIEESEEGMDFVGLVDSPAHAKKWITMSKTPKSVERYAFNDEKQIVKGVVLSTYQLIYRRSPDGFEYDVYFTKDDSQKILEMFASKGYHNNVNLMHDDSQQIKDVALIEMITINDKLSNIPEEFADQNLQAGSIIFAYKINDPQAWKFVKENGAGFSLEGWFKEVEVKFNINPKKKKAMSLMERLFGKQDKDKPKFDTENKDKYAEATTVDGDTIMWDGDLAEGTIIWLVPAEGDPVIATDRELSFNYDGTNYVVSVDSNGAITSIEEVAMGSDDEEMAEVLETMKADYEKKFNTQKKENDKLREMLQETVKKIDENTEAIEKLAEKKPKQKQGADKNSWRSLKGKK